MPLPFITADNRFAIPAETYAAAAAIRTPGIAKLLTDRLKEVDGLLVRYLEHRLIRLNDSLTMWGSFVRSAATSPVRTSYGTFDIADAPSIWAAVDILAPILASARGEVFVERKVA